LLTALGSFTSIAGQVTVDTSGLDLIQHLVPTSDWQVIETAFYMLKIIDVPGAFTARGYPAGLSAGFDFGVTGDPITGTDGRYRLEVSDGQADCSRTGDLDPQDAGCPVFTPNGLAIAYAGAQSWAGIRAVGGLTGPDHQDGIGSALLAGHPVRIHDHF
jgi:predicted acetyltransferase